VPKRIRIYLLVCAAALATLTAFSAGIYLASCQAPEFYRQALAQDPANAKQGSDAMLHQAAALASNLRRSGQWHALFTAEQINGWLAVDVPKNYPKLFPSYIGEPRVGIENNQAQLAFTWHKAGLAAVVSLEAEIFLRETNIVAIRICRARAGLLPLPLAGFIADLTTAGHEAGLQIEEQQIDGDPVLLLTIPGADAQGKSRPIDQLCLDSLEVNEGEIYVAGHTGHMQTAAAPSQQSDVDRQ
jgi:hypothetical protein